MSKVIRNGDHYFHKIKELPKKLKKVEVKSNRFIFGVGEASNHYHTVTVPKLSDMEVYEDDKGNRFFRFLEEGKIRHTLGVDGKTADHKEIIIKEGLYIQVPEREVDLFEQQVQKVID